jgi:hypothetical protein
VGRSAHPRRIAAAWLRSHRVDGLQIHDLAPRSAIAELADQLRPDVARADDVALCIACQLAGDVDGLTRACDRDDMRIGGLSLLYADVHARRLDPVDFHGHNSPVADVIPRPGSRRGGEGLAEEAGQARGLTFSQGAGFRAVEFG